MASSKRSDDAETRLMEGPSVTDSRPTAQLGPAQLSQGREVSAMADNLVSLREEFPAFRIWQEITGDRIRYVARSLRPGLNPHTTVTADLSELRAALEPSRGADPV
jgi:hypothetical protein